MYHACDVFCLPCHFDDVGVGEGFPSVIIEAMACGKPVISTRHVGIPEFLEKIVVEEKNVEQLAEAIRRVQASEQLRQELGKRNRELAEKYFSPNNVQKTATIVRRLCTKAI
jgi:glycosyltransferase involved in cell wall biosynthesis